MTAARLYRVARRLYAWHAHLRGRRRSGGEAGSRRRCEAGRSLTLVLRHVISRQTDWQDVSQRVGGRVALLDGEWDGRLKVAQQNEDESLHDETDGRYDTHAEKQPRANVADQSLATAVHVHRQAFLQRSQSTPSFVVTHLRATERHLPYDITPYYLPPDTSERLNVPALTPVRQAGTRLTFPERMEGWVNLGGWLINATTPSRHCHLALRSRLLCKFCCSGYRGEP